MRIEIIAEKQNPMLKRNEVQFRVDHAETGSTPTRLEIRKAVASALKIGMDAVFIRKFETKTGTSIAFGVANVYDSVEQAKLIEPEYIAKRNVPPAEKPKEEAPKEEKPKEEVKG
jgi:small subunit ribosomal protein S24e